MNNSCLGLAWLGACAYDPASPAPAYFTVGNAIGALAITLALQTFLKPIYRLRLGVRYLSLPRLYVIIFAGVGMTFLAALVPSFTVLHGNWWGFAIVYELAGASLFVIAYGAVAVAVTKPIAISESRVEQFARATARLLSEASESDHVDLLSDLQRSLPRLIKLAAFIERTGPVSAFYEFIHRRRIQQASYAHSILHVFADPLFCRSVVVRAPWRAAEIVRSLSQQRLHVHAAEHFLQEIGRQAILENDGIMAREVEYHGFGEAPVLSTALFSDHFIVDAYNPLGSYISSESITPEVLKRFNYATVRCYECLISQRQFGRSQVSFSIKNFYRTAAIRAGTLRKRGAVSVEYSIELNEAAQNAIALANRLMASANSSEYTRMFSSKSKGYRNAPLEILVEIVYDILCSISNDFEGSSDPFWHLVIDTVHRSFQQFGDKTEGMTPFQQRLILKLIAKLEDNMRGYYPAICRVLLASIGPYDPASKSTSTALNILRNRMYQELSKLSSLAAAAPDKVSDYIPNNVEYDPKKNLLTHTYVGGGQSDH